MGNTRALGEVREVRLTGGVVRYREVGEGEPVVFVHGILVNGNLWRDVVPPLAEEGFRCIVPDLPLGGHAVPMRPDADLTPPGLARLVAGFLEALDLRGVTLVGNDTGGAVCQIVVAEHPGRLGRLVLTNCDAYEAFFPWKFDFFFHHGPRLFGRRFLDLLSGVLRFRASQRLLMWTVSNRRPDEETLDAYFAPMTRDASIRRDLTKFLRDVSKRYTLTAARSFPDFHHPVLIVWGQDDPFFSPRLARRLQQDFPDATLEFLPGSRAFVPEDQPERLAASIGVFLEERAGTGGVR